MQLTDLSWKRTIWIEGGLVLSLIEMTLFTQNVYLFTLWGHLTGTETHSFHRLRFQSNKDPGNEVGFSQARSCSLTTGLLEFETFVIVLGISPSLLCPRMKYG